MLATGRDRGRTRGAGHRLRLARGTAGAILLLLAPWAGAAPEGRRGEQAPRPAAGVPAQATDQDRLRAGIDRLRRENAQLRAELRRAGVQRKAFAADLAVLPVQVLSRVGRSDRLLWLLDAGREQQVRAGDLLVQEHILVGCVVAVAGGSSLAEGVDARRFRCTVRLEGQEDEWTWQGDGDGRGRILGVAGAALRGALGRKVLLSSAASLGEGLELGEVAGAAEGGDGALDLLARTVAVRPGAPLQLLQAAEEPGPERFVQAERLAAVREQVRREELRKLQAELVAPSALP